MNLANQKRTLEEIEKSLMGDPRDSQEIIQVVGILDGLFSGDVDVATFNRVAAELGIEQIPDEDDDAQTRMELVLSKMKLLFRKAKRRMMETSAFKRGSVKF